MCCKKCGSIMTHDFSGSRLFGECRPHIDVDGKPIRKGRRGRIAALLRGSLSSTGSKRWPDGSGKSRVPVKRLRLQ